ncbi:hypothetical protein [Lysobacter sp. M15]|uniref:hypothetical protein n=1 Tax=Lysobacter sp. M15 TaxID=2916837 RepID=UPI001F569B53|nr:hypothetical protein [Lysobacter sp. M15]
MCHFITATLPKAADREALNTIARGFGRQFQPLASPAVTTQLPPGAAYFLTTLAHCDCGTVMGSARRTAALASDWPAEEAKLLKKGWSRAKAARALEQRREKEALKQEAKEQADRALAESLEGFVSGVLQSGLTAELGLLLHSYHGPLDEAFRILRHERVPPDAALAEVLPAAEEDVLYLFLSGA